VVVVMVVVVPVAFMHLPSLLIVVIMRMVPDAAFVRWALPVAASPYITATLVSPITLNPHIARPRHGGTNFAAKRRRSASNINADLADCWYGEGNKRDAACKDVKFPV
jgi:hypothetical protein